MISISCFANPTGGQVVGNTATISNPNANTVIINQTTSKSIINWQSYNIGKHEQVIYQQPNRSSISLNRINPSNGVSKIYGRIIANGQVWLLNPAGIFFGPSAYVNVGGLIATTGKLSDQDFLEGNYHFSNDSLFNGAIINQGQLIAAQHGLIALIGGAVSNEGYISAEYGQVALGAGNAFTLTFAGNDLIGFTVDKPVTQKATDQDGNRLPDGINNSGQIIANGGHILMSADAVANVLDNAVNVKGLVKAHSIQKEGSEIVINGSPTAGTVVIAGELNASGKGAKSKGGNITVTGSKIVLRSTAKLDASGEQGGGEILIGGNERGIGPLLHASTLNMASGAVIKANALTNGNGGKIVLWSDDYTKVAGNLSATGGTISGDGGLIETSSKKTLDVLGIQVDAKAAHGNTGTWLLDPTNIFIAVNQASATLAGMVGLDNSANTGTGGNPNTFAASGAVQDSLLTTGNLTTALASANVIVTTVNASGTGSGNITIVSPFSWSSSNTLTLTAENNIAINGAITTGTASSALILNAAGNVTQTAAIGGSGSLVHSGSGTTTLSLANTYSGGTVIKAGTIIATSTAANAFGTGAITLGDTSGNSNASLLIGRSGLNYTNAIVLASGTTGTLSVGNTGSAISTTFSGGVTGANNLTINSNGTTGTITFATNAVNNSGTITNTGAGTGTTTISASVGSNVTGLIENSTTSAFTISGALSMNSSGTTLTNSSGTKILTLSGGTTGTGNLTINNNSNLANGITLSGTSINHSGSITNSGNNSGNALISAIIGTNITGLTQNSTTSGLSVSGVNTYSTGTTIKAGVITASVSASALGTGPVTLGDTSGSNNASLLVATTGLNYANAIVLASGTSGTLTLGNSGSAISTTFSGGVTGTNHLTINSNATTGTITLASNPINNTGTITNTGSGTGTTTINTSVGSNVTQIIQNSTTSALTISGALSMNTGGTTLTNSSGTKILTVSGGTNGTGNLFLLNNSALAAGITLSGTTINHTGSISNTGSGAGSSLISAIIGTNVTGVTQNSTTSGLSLSGVNTYNSGTIIKAGTITATVSANALGTGSVTLGDTTGSNNASLLVGTNALNLANAIILASGNTGTLTLGNTGSAISATFSGGVTGSNDLTINSNATNGTITLATNAVNNFGKVTNTGAGTGTTTISAGVGANVTDVIENSTTSAFTISGAMTMASGGKTITNSSGTKILTISGGSTGSGNLLLNNNSALAAGITVSGTAINHNGTITNAGSGSGSVTFSAGVGTNITGITQNSTTSALTISGAVTVNAGGTTLTNSSGTALLSFTGGTIGTGSLIIRNNSATNNAITFATGSINHVGSVTNSGSGSGNQSIGVVIGTNVNGVTQNSATSLLTLSAANTYTGSTTISAGTLRYGIATAIPNGATAGNVTNNGILDLNGFSPTINGMTGGGVVDNVSAGGARSLTIGANNTTSSFGGTLQNTSGTVALIKTGTGTLTLTGASTYSGGTTILAGTLIGASVAANAFGTNTITIGNSAGGTTAASLLIGTTGLTYANPIVLASTTTGTLTIGNTGTAISTTFSGGVTGTNNLRINSNATSGTITFSSNPINNIGTVTATGAGTGAITINSVIGSNVTTLTQNSTTAALILNAANSYTGATTITAGTLRYGNVNAIPNGASAGNVTVSGTLDVNGFSPTINGLSGAGIVDNVSAGGTPALTIGANNATSTFTGTLRNTTGALAIIKTGTGTLTLSGANTYSGGTRILSGTIIGSSVAANAFGTSTITIGNSAGGSASASLLIGRNGLSYANPILLAANTTGTLTVGNTGSAISTTFTGGVTGTNNLTINSNATTGTLTFATNPINNNGTVTNIGAGTGTTTISGGIGANVTRVIENSVNSALTISGALTVNTGGTTLTNSSGTKILTLSGGTLGTGNLVLNNNSALASGITISGTTINHSGTITNSGTGTGSSLISAIINSNVTGVIQNSTTSGLSISGVNTYSTGTIIKAGTVTATVSASALGSGSVTLGDTAGSNNASLLIGTTGLNYANAIILATGTTGTLTLGNTGAAISTTFSGGVTGANNLTINSNATTGTITLSSAAVNNAGTVTNIGTGTGTTTISAGVGANVTGLLENSTTSAFTISGLMTVGASGKSLSNISGAKILTVSGGSNGSGNMLLNNNSTLTSGITISGSSLNHSGTITNAGTGTGSTLISAIIGTNISGVVQNSATSGLTVSGVNTFASETVIKAGTITATTSGSALGTGSVTLGDTSGSNNASLLIGTTGLNYANAIILASGNTGTLTLGNTGTAISTTFSGGVTGTNDLTINSNATTGTITLSTIAVNNTGKITNIGSGTGTTTISANIGANVTDIIENSTTSAFTISGALSVNSVSTSLTNVNGTKLLTLSGGTTGTGHLILKNNSAIDNAVAISGSALNHTGTVTNAGTGTGSVTVSSVISSNVTGVTQNSTGSKLILAASNTYGGDTSISAGTLQLANANALPTGVSVGDVIVNGTLDLNGFSTTIDGLYGTGIIDNISAGGNPILSIGNHNTGSTYDGIIQNTTGTVALTKIGSGTIILSGTNNYNGATNINNGILSLTNAFGLGNSSAISVANGGALDLNFSNNSAALANTNAISLSGSGSGAGALTLSNTSMTINSPLSLNGNSTIGGNGSGAMTFSGAINGSFNLTFTLPNAGVSLPAISLSSNKTLNVVTGGTITQTGILNITSTSSFNAGANPITLLQNNLFSGAVSLANTGTNNVSINNAADLTLATSTIGGSLTATANGFITLSGNITSSGSGNSIVLSGSGFNAGTSTLNPGAGNFLVWSSNPNPFGGVTPDNRGSITADFTQYNATYGVSTVLGTGNGFLYSLAPSVTPTLTGTISRSYNATTTADLTGHYSAVGAVNGDTIVFSPLTGNYATPNVGTNINVSVSGITIASASNGSEIVYGYALASTTANANIGTITPAAITISSLSGQSKVYGSDDPASAATAYGVTSGSLFGSTITGSMGRLSGENAGNYAFTQNTVSIDDGNGGNNFNITFNGTTNKFAIQPLTLTANINNQTKIYGDNDPAVSGITVNLTNVVNATVTDINGTSTLINDTGNVAVTLAALSRDAGEAVTNSPYLVTGQAFNAPTGSAAANYNAPTTLAGSASLSITQKPLTVSIVNQTKVYGTNDPALTGISASLNGIVSNPAINTWNGLVGVSDTGSVTLTSLTRNSGEDVSIYNITAGTFNTTISTPSNYAAPTLLLGSTLQITPAALTGTVPNIQKTYGTADPAASTINVILGGIVNNNAIYTWNGIASIDDTNKVSNTLASYSRAPGETVLGGPYSILTATFNALTGSSAGNYTSGFVYSGGSVLSINPATLTISNISADNKTYDGLTNTTLNLSSAVLNGVYGGDTVTVSNAGYDANFISPFPGNNIPVTVTNLGLTGASASNYQLTQPTGLVADITTGSSPNPPIPNYLLPQYQNIMPINLINPITTETSSLISPNGNLISEMNFALAPSYSLFTRTSPSCVTMGNTVSICNIKQD